MIGNFKQSNSSLEIQIMQLLLDVPFGGRNKRDLELGLLHCVINAGLLAGQVDDLARQLRISQRKTRAALDEIELRHATEPEELDRALRDEVIKPALQARRLSAARDTGRVGLHIERLVLRERFRQHVRENYGLVERGLDGTLLSVQPEVFITVLLRLTDTDEQDLKEALSGLGIQPTEPKNSVMTLFAESFAQSAGQAAGTKSVEWAERLLTGGFSDAWALAKSVLQDK